MNTTEMLSQIKSLLNARINLATMNLDNGTVIEAESFEGGQSVFIVTEDEKVAMPIGDYTLEDGSILVVAEEGVIAEIKDAMEEEVVEEEETEKVEAEEVVVEDVPEEIQPEVAAIVEAVVEVIAPALEEVKAEIEKLKKKYGEDSKEEDKKKEEMSKASRKPLRHNPERKTVKKINKFSQNKTMSTLDRVLEKLSK